MPYAAGMSPAIKRPISYLAIHIRQNDVQNHAGKCHHKQIYDKADHQRLVPGLRSLRPSVRLNTKQAAQKCQQGQISVVPGQQRNYTNCQASNRKQIAKNQPKPILEPPTGLVSKLIVQLVKTIIHERYPLKIEPLVRFAKVNIPQTDGFRQPILLVKV